MANVTRVLSAEIAIDTANTVADNVLVRVINTGNTALLTVSNSSANSTITLATNESVIIEKETDATVDGANMLAVPVAYRG